MSTKPTYPTYQNRAGWNALLPARYARTVPALKKRYAFVVIGAGYTGVASARRLAELNPDEEILLLEAGQVGEGSSARNSGFLISLPHNTHLSGGHQSPLQVAQKQISIYDAGLSWLHNLVQQHSIECGWKSIGKYHGAATQGGEEQLKRSLDDLRAWNIPIKEMSREELQEKTGTSYYKYGYHTANNVFVQPAALIRGLADHLPSNVILHENTPVIAVENSAKNICITLKQGQIHADKVVLANNGFAKSLGFLESRLITIYTYAGLTPVLSPSEIEKHGPEPEWGLIPANRLGTTLRKFNNERFMLRTAYSYETEQSGALIKTMLQDCYKRRYPHLKSHELELIWGGTTALTRNGATFFGEVSKNLFAVSGCNGAGVLKGSAYGKLLAELIMGSQSKSLSDALSFASPSWLPPEPLRKLAVTAAIKVQKRKAGAEF